MEFLQRITSMLTIIGTLLVCCGCFIPYVDSISCYRCDALDSKTSDCPGWMRRPINSVLDLHDRGGLYTHCVDVRLANGTVLHQDVVPTLPTCKASFIQTWHDTLVKTYDMEVSIICCEWNKCNGPNARAAFGPKYGGGNSILVWSLPILVITVISWWTQFNLTFSSNDLTNDEICNNSITKSFIGDRPENIHHHLSSFLQKCQNQVLNLHHNITTTKNKTASPNENQL
jgi:hypothetical protein